MLSRFLYSASIAASTNDLAHIDFPNSGVIVAVDWGLTLTSITSGDKLQFEVALASTAQSATNDAIGIVSVFTAAAVTSLNVATANKFVGPIQYAVPAGSRLYLHSIITGTTGGTIKAVLTIVPGRSRV
jgi:hypothetical protein